MTIQTARTAPPDQTAGADRRTRAGASPRGSQMSRTKGNTAAPERLPALLAGDLLDLLDRSRAAIAAACSAETTTERYAQAQLGALRAAAALLAQVAPRTVGSRPRSAWEAVAAHVPELGEQAQFFTASGRRARAAQAGIALIDPREADDLVREAEAFLGEVLAHLGLPARVTASARMTPVARW